MEGIKGLDLTSEADWFQNIYVKLYRFRADLKERISMNNRDLARAIGDIDDKYILEAAKVKKKKNKKKKAWWQSRALVTAASLLICCGIGFAVLQFANQQSKNGGNAGSTSNSAGGYFDEGKLTQPQTVTTVADGGTDDTNASGNVSQGPSITVEADTTDISLASGEEPGNENGGLDGIFENGGEGDISAYESYYRNALAEGMTLEDCYTEGDRTFISLARGTQTVAMSCRHADESLSDFMVSAEYPEQYDYTRYEEPFENSVPVSEQPRFLHAVFDSSEISTEIIEKRQLFVGYDEDGEPVYETSFGVVYPNLQVVEYTVSGLTAQEIFDMLILEN